MTLSFYQIDAFARNPFEGNPAAVVPLESWLPDDLMQKIAQENNLSETAFFVPLGDGYHIRWFTPTAEVDLCGHATLAAACVLFEELGEEGNEVVFESRSGLLGVERRKDRYYLDFPAQPPRPCPAPAGLAEALGVEPVACLEGEDWVVVLESQDAVIKVEPNLEGLKKLSLRGVIITAPGDEADFVARFFTPKYGIPEDPVTGSAYTQLAPYWAGRLGRESFEARQLSQRGGEIWSSLDGERVIIGGYAVKVLEGTLTLP